MPYKCRIEMGFAFTEEKATMSEDQVVRMIEGSGVLPALKQAAEQTQRALTPVTLEAMRHADAAIRPHAKWLEETANLIRRLYPPGFPPPI